MRLLVYVMAIIILVVLQLSARHADAHSQSYAYLDFAEDGVTVSGRFQAALRDLDRLYHLDSNGNGTITWGEVRQREAPLAQAALSTLSLKTGSHACKLSPQPILIDSHGGESYLVMPFTADCPPGPAMRLDYSFLAGIDAQHRGLVTVTGTNGSSRNFVVAAGQREITITSSQSGIFTELASFVGHGFHHILIGYDHILFVLTLLIGTAMQQRGGPLRQTFLQTAKVVTAFTLSHSVTLGLAAQGVLMIPVALAESLIAATIAIAAVNNIWPLITARLWLMALGFGLIHGVGFANVLRGLQLPQDNFLLSLLSFNIGVEAGQLAVVAIALPVIAIAARQSLARLAMPAANCAITALALMWLSDRTLGTSLMPF